MNLDIQQMKTFLTVVREQNFRRAAKVLNVSQPTVTMRIKTLEETVGATLLKRHGNSLTLTPSEEIIKKYAGKMTYVLQEVKDHLSSIPASKTRFTIAVIPSFITYIFPRLLKPEHYIEKFQYNVQSASSEKVYQLLMDGVIEFGIMRGPVEQFQGIMSTRLYGESIYLALPVDHYLNKKEEIFTKDIINENIITYKRRFWSFFESKLIEMGRKLEPKMQVDSEITAKKFVENNLGITLLPEYSIRKQDNLTISYKKVKDFQIIRDAYCVYNNEENQAIVNEFKLWVETNLGKNEL